MLSIAPAIADRCRLIKLRGETKVALESGWNQSANYEPDNDEIISHINEGNNYGVMPVENLIVIDCDSQELFDNLPEAWKHSLIVKTGKGHHIFLDCRDSPATKISITDPNTGEALGDIRGSGSPFYTVGAGSVHPDTHLPYQYVDPDADLVGVTWNEIRIELLERYSPIPIANTIPTRTLTNNTGTLTDKLGLRIEDFAFPHNAVRRANGDIQGSHPVHGSTTGMNFAINPQKNVWHCYRDNCGGDPVSWIAYAMCGESETNCNMLSKEKIVCVKNWLKDNGYAAKIKQMDDAYFADQLPNLPHINIDGLLYHPAATPPPIIPPTDPEVVARDIAEAQEKNKLPPFPQLPPGLFNDYMEFGKRVSYSLEEYHFAALLSMVSMTLGRRVKAQVGMTSVYPNVFVMVVGQTSISGKSTACNMVWESFRESVEHEEEIARINSVASMRGTYSDAALIQNLNDVYNLFWYYDDCTGFFDNIDGWNKSVLGSLCSIYDGSPVERTLSRRGNQAGVQSRWFCPTPYMSLLFNTTNKDIETVASSQLFTSGFFPRLMWFYGQGGEPRENDDVSEDDTKLVASMAAYVNTLREGIYNLPNDSIIFNVCKRIEQWKLKATVTRLEDDDESYRIAMSRGFIHAYKIAMILAMFDPEFQESCVGLPPEDYPVRVQIPDKYAILAIKIVEEYLIPRMMHVYNMCEASDNKNHQIVVMKSLDRFGGSATRTQLLRQTHLAKKELDVALDTLVESEEVKIHAIPNVVPGCGKPTMLIVKNS